jgi:hypothetical protein
MAGRWLCLAASVVSFLGAVVVSEVVPGRATGVDLQPNIDGLSLDEVFLAYLVGAVLVLVARSLVSRRHGHAHT